jgi:hypothetical protein
MMPTGGLLEKTRRKRMCRTAATGNRRRQRAYSDPAKAAVMSYAGKLVRLGLAEWAALNNGDMKLTLRSGEVFHLGEAAVTRIA